MTRCVVTRCGIEVELARGREPSSVEAKIKTLSLVFGMAVG
jgi:hypothetical protein